MTPTPELRTRLRALIDERIPPGRTDADTRFTDAELDEILTAASTIEAAAAECWLRKATRAFSERGGLEKSRAGDESHEFVSLKEYRDHCLAMAELFRRRDPGTGSRLMGIDTSTIEADVLGSVSSAAPDISRLIPA